MRPDTFTASVAALPPGGTIAQAVRHNFETDGPINHGDLQERVRRMRNAMQSSVVRATEATGNVYEIESGVFYNRQHVPVAVVIIVRTDGTPVEPFGVSQLEDMEDL